MFCQKCGTQNSDEASFCIKCGNNLKSAKSEIERKGITLKLDNISVSESSGKEYRTLHFSNTGAGQKEKVRTINALSNQGWKIVTETITQGNLKGKKACCLATICLPFGFCAGSTKGTINVTLERDTL